uniref:Ribosomal protein S9 n=1 Tax=Hildenbrandia rubra TaxID=31481 RepID=A0A1C9CGA3_9FLOR|nr:ribosomal protein S9 [Hildenbrandia rubra]AOM67411.1 ribosomal protein S9 [Hildenbrandia rubra]
MTINLKNSAIMYYGTGRRKRAIARVRIIPGSGKIIINSLPGPLYLQFNPASLATCSSPLKTLRLSQEYDIYVNAQGGGLSSQADAICLGVARALCHISSENKQILKTQHYLTRDSRVKERKKYGLRKARKAPQYSKR